MVDRQIQRIRTSAALTWSDHVVCVRVEGTDAFDVVDRVCTSELHLRDGQILSSLLLDKNAVPVADLFIARDDEDFLLLSEGLSGTELMDHIRAEAPPGADFEVLDLGSSHRVLSLNGPYAWEVLAGVAGPEAVGLPYLTFFLLGEILCFRTGKTGEFGYDLLVPREEETEVAGRFEEVGSDFDLGWADLAALDVCALENWFFNIRREGQFGFTPLELQLQWRVSSKKEFVGSAALEKRRQEGIQTRLTFFESEGSVSVGDRVFHGKTDLGRILNASHSPIRGDHIGLAMISLDHASAGVGCFQAEADGHRIPIRTISPPALHNRSLFINPQLHSYLTREEFEFPPVAPPSMFDFAEKAILVTGASRGLGRAMAQAFGQAGGYVGIGFAFREKDANETLATIQDAGGAAELCRFDVRDRAATDQAVRAFASRRSKLDVLVNNAGVASDGFAATLPESEWNRVLDVNLTGTFNGCRSAASLMMAQKRGVIVNVSSVAGSRASPGQANYAASKGGVLALTKTLAAELAPSGIRVNAVVPGLFSTGMGARLNHRILEERIAAIPLGRLGTPRELADVVLFLASDAAAYITGQAITVDGGLTL